MAFVWVAAAIVGFFLAVVGSRSAVRHAAALAQRAQLPEFFVGLTLLAIGTDLPEIANSIVASATGNGDVNVGDSVGSAATQITLVLGLLPFFGRPLLTSRRGIVAAGLLTAAALSLAAVLVVDGFLSRPDGLILVAVWIAAIRVVSTVEPSVMPQLELPIEKPDEPTTASRATRTFLALLVVAGGATLAVWGVVQVAESLGVPVFIIAFFGASLGTSLPELVVQVTAVRGGRPQLAVGNAFGASLVDSTLSIGIGPLLFPVAVTASLAVRGALAAATVALIVTLLFSRISSHDRRSGLLLLILYGMLFAVVVG